MKCARMECSKEASGKSKYCPECGRIARQKWLEMIRAKSSERQERTAGFEKLWAEAVAAGMAAGEAVKPQGMRVVQHANPIDDDSAIVRAWDVPEGPCGFAWVVVRPGVCSFARWAKANQDKLGQHVSKEYYGGMNVYWVSEFNQSIQRKAAFAGAFAAVLCKAGIDAHAMSRMD